MQHNTKERIVVVFAGGASPPSEAAGWIPSGARVIAADSGLDHAHRLGAQADLLVGDLDSVSSAAAERHEGDLARYPEAKDETDLELAMDAAAAATADLVMVVGGHGGRLDHFLANAALLADRRWTDIRIVWLSGYDLATVIHRRARLYGKANDLVSLIPSGGPARGVTTEGLKWPLQHATLIPGSTLGISNRFTGFAASIEVRQGVVLAVQPGAILANEPIVAHTPQ